MADKNITILETQEVRVREMILDPENEVPWHTHGEIDDTMYCLEGAVRIELRNPEERILLLPGERCQVTVGRPHRVVAAGDRAARYLLVQGVGCYDFQPLES